MKRNDRTSSDLPVSSSGILGFGDDDALGEHDMMEQGSAEQEMGESSEGREPRGSRYTHEAISF